MPDSIHSPASDSLQGEVLSSISRQFVQLHTEFYGKGPTKAKTYVDGDLVVVLLRGGFTRVEKTLLDQGRGKAVIEQRMEFQEVMRARYSEVIGEATGRKVIAFMSGSHQEPDLLAEVFVLEPTGEGYEVLAESMDGDIGK